jgi:hypothetical protein
VGVPTFLAGLAGQAIAGRYIDKAVDRGIETLAKMVGLNEQTQGVKFSAGLAKLRAKGFNFAKRI